MSSTFISGIPASGKSYLAKKVAGILGIGYFSVDDLREEMSHNFDLKEWTDFFLEKDEDFYWNTTTCDKHWDNLRKQSEAFWPAVLKNIKNIQETGKSTIFEGVNILPHLAHRDLDFKGIILLGESLEVILDRNKQNPRWGKIERLQIKEAEMFWGCERLKYKEEAKKYGFKTFSDPVLAEEELIKLILRSSTS